jgi:hypothetical protein
LLIGAALLAIGYGLAGFMAVVIISFRVNLPASTSVTPASVMSAKFPSLLPVWSFPITELPFSSDL